ncbi:MAG: Ca2+-dependent phosphoinositide-specific phospholipase C [Gemmatimonadota bacterium]
MPTMPAYLDWLYDAVCFKASHNSYQGSNEKPQDPSKWDFGARYDTGCRGFELDLYQCDPMPGGGGCEWSVSHEGESLGNRCWPLGDYLRHMRRWSELHPGHDPLFVVLDLKSVRGPYAEFAHDLDAYLGQIMGDRLFTPGHLLRSGDPDLVRAVRNPEFGWGPLAAMLETFVFCLSGTGKASRAAYAAFRPHDRLCFTDMDLPEDVTLTQETQAQGHQVVINVPAGQMYWGKNWLKHNPGFLLRVYDLSSSTWKMAVSHGPNILATDDVELLSVGADAFRPS